MDNHNTTKKVGILTLPLHTNYGGNLQAFALMTVLASMNCAPVLINRKTNRNKGFRLLLAIGKRTIEHYLLRKKGVQIFREFKEKKEYPIISRNTQKFIDQYITPKTISIHSSSELKRTLIQEGFHSIVVGSDQVWRLAYTPNILDYFLSSIEHTNQIKKISYAASFGTGEKQFSDKLTEKIRTLLKKFDAISVREDEAVSICKKVFDVSAVHVLDPTMLVNVDLYRGLFLQNTDETNRGNILSYVLDINNDTNTTISILENTLSLNHFKVGYVNKTIREEPYPSVESWLKGFDVAGYVITDSFHACVFSILFNKPFIVFGNTERGLSRFSSLLRKFNLEDRLILSHKELTKEKVLSPIDWKEVNRILEVEKEFSMQFLRTALSEGKH